MYQQWAYKIGERRPGYRVENIPMVIGGIGGGVNRLRKQKSKVLKTNNRNMTRTWREMLKIVLNESGSKIRKVWSKIITAV